MEAIRFDRSLTSDLKKSLQHEWLETNGMGGFASSTVAGANTRRYHGLLVAATEPPALRHLLLARFEETLVVAGRRFDLSTNLYPGTVHPEGYRHLAGFRLDPFPVFTFEAGGVTLEKRIFMPDGENTVVVQYTANENGCSLEVRPLVAFRGYHDLTQVNRVFNGTLDAALGLVSLQPYEALPRLWLAHNAKAVANEGHWYFNFEYPMEQERGLDFHEDLYCPFAAAFDLAPAVPAVIIASTIPRSAADAPALEAAEKSRRQRCGVLKAAADQFIVRRGAHRTVIAGYPWFADWGRDTMIALPGLTLSSGRSRIARDVLLTFAGALNQGMLPNRFPDTGAPHETLPEYNTADATLWFFEAIRQYLENSHDAEFVREQLYEKLKDIVAWHLRGTRFNIHVDADGLLIAGDASTSLTWMDARVGGRPRTPRNGKPVEIQALWYNALRFVERLARDFGDEGARASHARLAEKAAAAFDAAFWDEHAGYFCDVVDGEKRDLSLRPNQVIALSLGYCCVPEHHARGILSAVEKHLLTPFGLRTLAPFDTNYYGRYTGSPAERDSAYHDGPVWPWLLGHFIAADVRFNGSKAHARVPALLEPLQNFMTTRGAGQLPELFDGDAPHEPRGCFAQAWSVAEVLRASSQFR